MFADAQWLMIGAFAIGLIAGSVITAVVILRDLNGYIDYLKERLDDLALQANELRAGKRK
jgi:hypothetical protein